MTLLLILALLALAAALVYAISRGRALEKAIEALGEQDKATALARGEAADRARERDNARAQVADLTASAARHAEALATVERANAQMQLELQRLRTPAEDLAAVGRGE